MELAFTPVLVYGLLITSVLGGTLIVELELNASRAVTSIEKHSVRALFGCETVLADYKVARYVVLRPDPLPRLPNG